MRCRTHDAGKLRQTKGEIIHKQAHRNINDLRSGMVPTFKTGLKQVNRIGVLVSASELRLYVNGQYLTSIQQSRYTHGAIGVFANDSGHQRNEANPWSQVLFRNAQVWGS